MRSAKRLELEQQLLALPETAMAEIIGEVLMLQAPQSGDHAVARGALLYSLVANFDRDQEATPRWWLLHAPELHLHEDVLVPDLAGWHRTRMPQIPEGHRIMVVPDWVCEVLSPATARTDRTIKMDIYAREGVQHVWLVDTAARTVESYALQAAKYTRLACDAGDSTPRIAPFDAADLELKYLWDTGRPRES